MHICFISHEYPLWATGGIGSFIQTIGQGLVQQGHKVSVIGVGDKSIEENLHDKGVAVYRLAAPRLFRNRGSVLSNAILIRKKLKQLHKQDPIDVVETPEAGLYYMPDRSPYVKVIRMHGGHHFFAESEQRKIKWQRGILENLSFRNADAFIAVSEYVKNHTSKYLSTGDKPIEVIRLSINQQLFRQADLSKTIKHRLVFAGTVCEKKGIRQLLQALPEVIAKYPDVHLDVYGRDWTFPDNSSYIAYLETLFSKEVLRHVTFHGAVKFSKIPAQYEKAELCVFPSLMETQGLVAPEAMTMGKPVLFSNTGPGPETIRHLETGLLCDPYNPDDIKRQILYAFDNPEKLAEIAAEGQKFAHEVFDLKNAVQKNIDFYTKLIRSN